MTAEEFQLLLQQRDVMAFALLVMGAIIGAFILATPERIRRGYVAFVVVALCVVVTLATQAGLVPTT